ncbi:MAG: transglycosylase domain-containing protein [Candidatus Moraniibacteriota bacterium]
MSFFRKKRRVPGETKPKGRFWGIAWKVALWGAAASFAIVVGAFAYIAKDLPNPGTVNKRVLAESTKIFDRTGTHLLYEVHGEEKRTVIPFSDMPDVIKYATISLEDQDFYNHYGIKLTSIARSLLKDIVSFGKAQGGSTITQQFVKNSLLTNEKTFIRKVKEVILSLEIETKFSKDEILAMYLNEIPYGSNAYGIEAAAQTFFGKPARELSLDEAALIAALPQATAYYSPYGSHRDALIGRKEHALKTMARLGYITEEQMRQAVEERTLDKLSPQKDIIAAPHFVMYIKDYLQQKYGDRAVEEGGLKVITTLDWDKQQVAEAAVREGAENNKRWRAENAALVAMDPKTGHVLAMVGSKDYFDVSIDGQVNVAIRDRQPGSSFKPYVYLAAFAKGYLPETILYDTKTQFETAEGKSYEPNNYDGKSHGPLPMMKTLGGSLNIAAVKTLYLVGVKDAIQLAKNLGITGLNDPSKLGLSLVLGGGEVKLLDHVSAYSTLATGGIRHPQTTILRIEDASGATAEEFKPDAGERVIDEKYVAMLDSVLSDNANRAWVFGENSPLRFDNRPVVAKTGTTNEFRDGWTIGYTPSLAVGVWAGNNDNRAMVEGADGVNVAAPIWRAFLDKALTNYAIEEFPKYNPDDEIGEGEGKTDKPMLAGKLEQKEDLRVCEIPGEKDKYCLANSYCRDKDADKKDFVSDHDILYYVSRDDPRGPIPDKPDRDPQYKNWEKGVKDWYEKQKGIVVGEPPKDECQADDFKAYLPKISLSVPGSAPISSSVTFSASVDAPYGVEGVTYSVNGSSIGSSSSSPYSVSYTTPSSPTALTIEAEVKDKNGNKAKDEKSMAVN